MRCPKCNAELASTGCLTFGDQPLAVYQCDHCTVPWKFGGTTFQTALTFAVDDAGNMINPETFEPINLN